MAKSDVVYVDTNALIEAVETKGYAQRRLFRLMDLATQRSSLRIVTSIVSLAEVLVVPLRQGNQQIVGVYRDLFDGDRLDVREVDGDTFFLAALLRADNRRLKLFDGVHFATALAARADVIVTRDTDFAYVRRGPASAHFGMAAAWPTTCTPDDPTFAALVERHA